MTVGQQPGDERLEDLRERVAVVGSLPPVDRPAVFAEVNAAIVAELETMASNAVPSTPPASPHESGPTGT